MLVKRLHPEATLPSKALLDAGFDLSIVIEPDDCDRDDKGNLLAYLTLWGGEVRQFTTGLSIWLEDPSLMGLVLPRSKLGS